MQKSDGPRHGRTHRGYRAVRRDGWLATARFRLPPPALALVRPLPRPAPRPPSQTKLSAIAEASTAEHAPTSNPAATSVGQCQPTVTREAPATSATAPSPTRATIRSLG